MAFSSLKLEATSYS